MIKFLQFKFEIGKSEKKKRKHKSKFSPMNRAIMKFKAMEVIMVFLELKKFPGINLLQDFFFFKRKNRKVRKEGEVVQFS